MHRSAWVSESDLEKTKYRGLHLMATVWRRLQLQIFFTNFLLRHRRPAKDKHGREHCTEKKTEERNKPNYSNRVHNGCILCQHCLEMEEVESWERETGSPPSLVVRNYARQNSAVKHDDDYLYITNNLTVYIRSYVIIPDVQKLRQRCHVTTWSRDRVCI